MEHTKAHQTILTVINAFTAMCLGVLFAYNLQRGLFWFGVPHGAWQTPFVTIAYLVSFLISWKIIVKASVGMVDAPSIAAVQSDLPAQDSAMA